jgi:DNA-binding NtrC family response regulator
MEVFAIYDDKATNALNEARFREKGVNVTSVFSPRLEVADLVEAYKAVKTDNSVIYIQDMKMEKSPKGIELARSLRAEGVKQPIILAINRGDGVVNELQHDIQPSIVDLVVSAPTNLESFDKLIENAQKLHTQKQGNLPPDPIIK